MDCEKFDHHVMDALYGELDELTYEALKRHVEGCARCASVWSSLKSTRSATTLPLDEPSEGLEERILSAEKTVHRHAPWPRKIMRAAAWAGSHAMRPQLAMAALFMFVIGSSLLLLRARPGTMAPPVQVSEQGRPESQPPAPYGGDHGARPGSPAPASEAKGDARMEERGPGEAGARAPGAADNEPTGRGLTGASAVAAAAASVGPGPGAAGGAASPPDLLAEGRARRLSSGCDAALPSFEAIVRDHPQSAEKGAAEHEIQACRQQAKAGIKPLDGGAAPTATGSSP